MLKLYIFEREKKLSLGAGFMGQFMRMMEFCQNFGFWGHFARFGLKRQVQKKMVFYFKPLGPAILKSVHHYTI